MGQPTLRVTIQTVDDGTVMTLEGRVTGPWAAELSRIWAEKAPLLISSPISVDLSNVTYADTNGKEVLREIYALSRAKLLTGDPWTQHLAGEIRAGIANSVDKEAVDVISE
jgi:anti-anti-sigma regulatory factor